MKVRVQIEQLGPPPRVVATAEHHVDAATPLTFGRSPDQNRLVVPDERRMVSSRHGCLELRADGLWVVDLGSRNGTSLDGAAVDGGGARLGEQSVIGLGDFRLRVEVLAAAAVDGAATDGDFGATIVHFDAEHEAADVWEALCQRYAHARDASPAERRALLRDELAGRCAGLLPKQARALVQRVLARAGGVAVAPEPEPPPVDPIAVACHDGVRALAAQLVGERPFADAREVQRFVELIAMFFELTMRWLGQTIHARSEFEDEFGAEVTMVFQRSNNPLKQQQGTVLARTLLDWALDRDVDTVRGQLAGVYRDLTQHQLGLLVGVKQAIAAVMERLAPDAIEALASKDAKLFASKGARAWDVYRQIYRDFLEEKSKLFHEVISPAIRRGYLTAHDAPDAARPDGSRDAPPAAGSA